MSEARILFPMLMLLAVWLLLLAGVRPRRQAVAESTSVDANEEALRRETARA